METIIYHNPRCSKSRQSLQLLIDNGITPKVIEYLKQPPTHQQLDSILRGLNMEPRDLIRHGETEYNDLNLDDESMSRNQLIEHMIQYPQLIERPIIIAGDQIIIGRPPEAILEILN